MKTMCHYADAGSALPATGCAPKAQSARPRAIPAPSPLGEGWGEGSRASASVFALFVLATLAACGSIPSAPEEKPQSAPTETAAETAATEAPIPPEAAQQFDSAVALLNSGNVAAAEQAFRALSSSYPAYSGALLNLAILQARAGKLDDAEKTIKDAIERDANSAAAFNQLGIVYRRSGRFKEADEAYQRALQIDPDYALAHLNLGVLCDLYLQQPQRALEAYERYLALAAAPDAKVNGWVTELKTRLGSQPRSASTGE